MCCPIIDFGELSDCIKRDFFRLSGDDIEKLSNVNRHGAMKISLYDFCALY